MDFRSQQKLITLNDHEPLNVNSLLHHRVMRILTKRLRLESHDFRYKVAMYLS